MKLALDHHYSKLVAEQRALLTNDVADFMVIVRRWAVEHRSHQGLILTSDRQRPRTREATCRFVDDLAELLAAHAGEHDTFQDRVRWL